MMQNIDEIEYICPKCGSKQLDVKQEKDKTALYCKECNKRIKWLAQKEVSSVNAQMKRENVSIGKAFKSYAKFKGATIIRCPICKCQLYNSAAPEPQGQFDLVGAKYCPKCGVEFV